MTQSLFNPTYFGFELLDWAHIPVLGVGAWWSIYVLTTHAIWSIAVQLIQGSRPKSSTSTIRAVEPAPASNTVNLSKRARIGSSSISETVAIPRGKLDHVTTMPRTETCKQWGDIGGVHVELEGSSQLAIGSCLARQHLMDRMIVNPS